MKKKKKEKSQALVSSMVKFKENSKDLTVSVQTLSKN